MSRKTIALWAMFGLAVDATEKPLSFDVLSFVPSSDEVRHVHVNVLRQFSRGHFIDDVAEQVVFLAPLYTDHNPPKFCTI